MFKGSPFLFMVSFEFKNGRIRKYFIYVAPYQEFLDVLQNFKVIHLNIWPWKTKNVFPGFPVWFTSGEDFQTSVSISIVLWGPVGNWIKIQFPRVSPGDPTADQPLTDRGARGSLWARDCSIAILFCFTFLP